MTINAKDVNKLRKQTNAGMMDCKNALIQAEGDFEKAVDILRKRGQKISTKRADVEATEGAVFTNITESEDLGIIISLSCETDFVAKNEKFIELGNKILSLSLRNNPSNLEDLLNINDGSRTIKDYILDLMGKIGEKIEINNFQKVQSTLVIPYTHTGNNLGVLVGFAGVNPSNQAAKDAGRDVAMQIAAMNPLALNKDEIDPKVIARELEIAKEQASMEGKPENVTEKIAQGKLNKFFKENTLLDQSYIKDPSINLQKYLQIIDNSLTISEFKRVSIK